MHQKNLNKQFKKIRTYEKQLLYLVKLLNKLYEYHEKGHSMDDIILNAITANWKDFYEPKQQKSYNTPKSQTLNTNVNVWDMIEQKGASNG